MVCGSAIFGHTHLVCNANSFRFGFTGMILEANVNVKISSYYDVFNVNADISEGPVPF